MRRAGEGDVDAGTEAVTWSKMAKSEASASPHLTVVSVLSLLSLLLPNSHAESPYMSHHVSLRDAKHSAGAQLMDLPSQGSAPIAAVWPPGTPA